ncbi:MAG: hypothetical protein H6810_06765 [Phycisphaeraceae bacterium]|nr:MAG: hypothetical protein H6810_06765 [Phycisphaeraceae bacterium]
MTSIRRMLTLSLGVAIGLLFAVLAVAVFFSYRGAVRAQLDESLRTRASTFAAMVVEDREEDELAFDFEGDLRVENQGVWLRITDSHGEVLAVSDALPRVVAGETPRPGGPPAYRTIADGGDTRYRKVILNAHASVEGDDDDNRAPTAEGPPVTVEVVADASALLRDERRWRNALIAAFCVAVGVTMIAVRLVVRRGLAPVHRLTGELDRIGPATLSLDIDDHTYPAELRPIAAAVNGLLERVLAGVERERRFTDAAAHELRTPIAELTMLTGVAGRYPDEARQRRAIEEAGAIAAEMNTLLESLLLAARGRAGGKVDATTPLGPIVRTQLDKHAGLLRERSISLETEIDDAAGWRGPAGAALMILRNLVENAGEYTPEGGMIRVAVAGGVGSAGFEIENGPVDLSAADADQMFEPFWRADPARSGRRHAGLGLAIVDAFCETLGLMRRAEMTTDRTLRIRIEPTKSLTPDPI